MQFFKTLSAFTAMAALAAAAPVPGIMNAEVDHSGYVQEVAAPVTAAAAAASSAAQPAATTAAAAQPEQGKEVELATAGASSAASVATTTTITLGAQDSAQTATAAAASAPGVTIMTVEPTPAQPASTPVATTTVAAASAPSATAAASSANTAPSSSSASSSGSSSSSSSSGSGLTVVNMCNFDVSAGENQGLNNADVGGTKTLSANGGSANFAMDGSSQVVKVYRSGTDIYSGPDTNAEVEWTVSGTTTFFDLSLLKGNPFMRYGQKLESPCLNHLTGTDTISCAANNADCLGAYSNLASQATLTCPLQEQGLTYTLCQS